MQATYVVLEITLGYSLYCFLSLSRFTKDDKAKDLRIATLEKESIDLKSHIDEVVAQQEQGPPPATEDRSKSRTCIIL